MCIERTIRMISKWFIISTLLCIPYLYMIRVMHTTMMAPLMDSFNVPFNTTTYVDMANMLMGNDVWYMYGDVCIMPKVVTVLLASWFYVPGTFMLVGSYLWSTGNIGTLLALCIGILYATMYR